MKKVLSILRRWNATMKTLTHDRLPQGIGIQYQTDSNLFNLSHLHARTKLMSAIITELQHTDDCTVVAHLKEDLQTALHCFSEAYKSLRLTLNIGKTKVLHQPVPGQSSDPARKIYIDKEELENVEYFAYLGSHLSQRADTDVEIQHRIRCASFGFGRLSCQVFNNHNIRTHTRLLVYKAGVIPTLLYGCETWVTHRKHLKNQHQQLSSGDPQHKVGELSH
ncbi:uncharacterized protein LOC123373623 isoform X2 [Mauremys mutica]|uniref:uncharacterized protein LOC123373623 isoform X2 n=1 Tax=Mauremys mutica TaxID=74926 RepID=UPI001D162511|nr:uncharacterized protein LOC123373623 isoform X2 [Mauremys mutica]